MPKRKKDENFVINKLANTSTNSSIYKSLIENVNIDEITYFNGMSYDGQMKIIDDLTILKIMCEINTPYRIQLLNRNISLKFKIVALKKNKCILNFFIQIPLHPSHKVVGTHRHLQRLLLLTGFVPISQGNLFL